MIILKRTPSIQSYRPSFKSYAKKWLKCFRPLLCQKRSPPTTKANAKIHSLNLSTPSANDRAAQDENPIRKAHSANAQSPPPISSPICIKNTDTIIQSNSLGDSEGPTEVGHLTCTSVKRGRFTIITQDSPSGNNTYSLLGPPQKGSGGTESKFANISSGPDELPQDKKFPCNSFPAETHQTSFSLFLGHTSTQQAQLYKAGHHSVRRADCESCLYNSFVPRPSSFNRNKNVNRRSYESQRQHLTLFHSRSADAIGSLAEYAMRPPTSKENQITRRSTLGINIRHARCISKDGNVVATAASGRKYTFVWADSPREKQFPSSSIASSAPSTFFQQRGSPCASSSSLTLSIEPGMKTMPLASNQQRSVTLDSNDIKTSYTSSTGPTVSSIVERVTPRTAELTPKISSLNLRGKRGRMFVVTREVNDV